MCSATKSYHTVTQQAFVDVDVPHMNREPYTVMFKSLKPQMADITTLIQSMQKNLCTQKLREVLHPLYDTKARNQNPHKKQNYLL